MCTVGLPGYKIDAKVDMECNLSNALRFYTGYINLAWSRYHYTLTLNVYIMYISASEKVLLLVLG